MHLLEPEPERPGHFNHGEVDVFVGSNYVLSVRNRSKRGFLGVRERCESEPELLRHGSGFVLYALMDAVVDRYFPIIDALEVELEQIEQQIDRKSTRLNSSHLVISYAVFCLKKKNTGEESGSTVDRTR